MKHQTKVSGEKQQPQAASHLTQQNGELEFASVEELLRFDAAQTPVPPGVASRLQQSASDIPAPRPSSWWNNLFGR